MLLTPPLLPFMCLQEVHKFTANTKNLLGYCQPRIQFVALAQLSTSPKRRQAESTQQQPVDWANLTLRGKALAGVIGIKTSPYKYMQTGNSLTVAVGCSRICSKVLVSQESLHHVASVAKSVQELKLLDLIGPWRQCHGLCIHERSATEYNG